VYIYTIYFIWYIYEVKMIDCIEWTGTIGADGYGKKWNNKKRNWVQAHRWVYEQEVGAIPDGLMIRHLCHNKRCVNPAHLEPGTMKENRADDIAAGKDWFNGELNPNAKLSNIQRQEIIDAKPVGKPPYGYIRDIAKKYDIDRTHVYRIWSKE
jgi:hypothetical protein